MMTGKRKEPLKEKVVTAALRWAVVSVTDIDKDAISEAENDLFVAVTNFTAARERAKKQKKDARKKAR